MALVVDVTRRGLAFQSSMAFEPVDRDDFDRGAGAFELQSELFRNRGEKVGRNGAALRPSYART